MLRRILEDDSNETTSSILRGLDFYFVRQEWQENRARERAASPTSPTSNPPASSSLLGSQHFMPPPPGGAMPIVRERCMAHRPPLSSPSGAHSPNAVGEVVEWEAATAQPCRAAPASTLMSHQASYLSVVSQAADSRAQNSTSPLPFPFLSLLSECSEGSRFEGSLVPGAMRPTPAAPAAHVGFSSSLHPRPLSRQQLKLKAAQHEARKCVWRKITFGMSDSGLPSPRTMARGLGYKKHRLKAKSKPATRESKREGAEPHDKMLDSVEMYPIEDSEYRRDAVVTTVLTRRASSLAQTMFGMTAHQPTKQDIVAALRKAKAHFESIALRGITHTQPIRGTNFASIDFQQAEMEASMDGFQRLTYIGLYSSMVSRLAYAVSHTDQRLAGLLDEVNARLGKTYLLRGFGIVNEDSPLRCMKYVVLSTASAPLSLTIAVAAATAEASDLYPTGDVESEVYSMQLSSRFALARYAANSVMDRWMRFVVLSEEFGRFFIRFEAAAGIVAQIRTVLLPHLVSLEAQERARMEIDASHLLYRSVRGFLKETGPDHPLHRKYRKVVRDARLAMTASLEGHNRARTALTLRRTFYRNLRAYVSRTVVTKAAYQLHLCTRFALWRAYTEKRSREKTLKSDGTNRRATVEWAVWFARRADELLFHLPVALRHAGVVTSARSPSGDGAGKHMPSITLVGHGVGGAIASVMAIKMNCASMDEDKMSVQKLYTMGSPRIFCKATQKVLSSLSVFEELNIDYVAFGHYQDPALVLPRTCVPATDSFFDVSQGPVVECVTFNSVRLPAAEAAIEAWRFHSIDLYVMSFLTGHVRNTQTPSPQRSPRRSTTSPRKRDPNQWSFSTITPQADETQIAFWEWGLREVPDSDGLEWEFSPALVRCLRATFINLATNNRLSSDVVLGVCSQMRPIPNLRLVHQRIQSTIAVTNLTSPDRPGRRSSFSGTLESVTMGESLSGTLANKPLRLTSFLAWMRTEFSHEGDFVFRFLEGLQWKMSAGELVRRVVPSIPLGVKSPSPANEVPLMRSPLDATQGFSTAARAMIADTFTHYSRIFPPSPFDAHIIHGVPVATFSCFCLLLNDMRWPPGFPAVQFAEYGFTTVEKLHIADPFRKLMLHSGDSTGAGFEVLMQLIVDKYGQEFFLERLWILGYNEQFQHSVTRGTMRNIHARGTSLCGCLSHDPERLRHRRQDEKQFRLWLSQYLSDEHRLAPVEPVDGGHAPSPTKSAPTPEPAGLHRRSTAVLVTPTPVEAHRPRPSLGRAMRLSVSQSRDAIDEVYGETPFLPPAEVDKVLRRQSRAKSIAETAKDPMRRSVGGSMSQPSPIATRSLTLTSVPSTNETPKHASSKDRRGTLSLNTPKNTNSVYSSGVVQLLNGPQRAVLGAAPLGEGEFERRRRSTVIRELPAVTRASRQSIMWS